MICHLSEIHDIHCKSNEKDVIKASCTRFLQKDVDEYDEIHWTITPLRKTFEKYLSTIGNMRLDGYL